MYLTQAFREISILTTFPLKICPIYIHLKENSPSNCWQIFSSIICQTGSALQFFITMGENSCRSGDDTAGVRSIMSSAYSVMT